MRRGRREGRGERKGRGGRKGRREGNREQKERMVGEEEVEG